VVVVLFGVTGAGKTVVGQRLARELGWTFHDGDTYHAPASLEKMRAGVPLTDEDRRPWLATLRDLVADCLAKGENAVLACSALKAAYRDYLRIDDRVRLVYLKGDVRLIAKRLQERQGHFMDPALLQSQFDTLEEPRGEAITVDVSGSPQQIVDEIRMRLAVQP
jgi:gluconokinase